MFKYTLSLGKVYPQVIKSLIFSTLLLTLLTPTTFALSFSLDGSGWLEKNGKSFLPLGLYSVPTSSAGDIPINSPANAVAVSKDMFCNTIINPYWAVDSTSSLAFLDKVGEKNMYGIVGFDDDSISWKSNLEVATVSAYINTIKQHPNLMAYTLPDEPLSTQGGSVDNLIQLYKTIKQADSQSIVIMVDFLADAPKLAKNAYDVFAYDAYPIGEESVQTFRNLFKTIVSQAAPKPVWGILQAYVNPPQWQEPTLAELRSMAYIMLIQGAKGILSYTYACIGGKDFDGGPGYCIHNYPNLIANLKKVFEELQRFSDILVLPNAPNVKASAAVTEVDFVIKNQGNKYYVGAVNWKSSDTSTKGHYPGQAFNNVKIILSGLSKGKVTILAGNGKGNTLSLDEGTFYDSFSPYDAKMYQIDTFATSPPQ